MDLLFETERLDARNPADLARAAHLLRAGETVAFPTETVYGLGANALSATAAEKIFIAKQRPHWDPLIVHVAGRSMLTPIIEGNPHRSRTLPGVEAIVDSLLERFWPGPLTLLLPRTPAIPDIVTAGRPMVAVRMPAHPVALELIRLTGLPIAAPSANRFGHTSPTTAQHVLDDLDGRIAAVLDGGPAGIGVESTVVGFDYGAPDSFEAPRLVLYRPGAVTQAMLEEVVGPGRVELFRPATSGDDAQETLPSPGVGIRHYAPRAQLRLVEVSATSTNSAEQALAQYIDSATRSGGQLGVLLPDRWNPAAADLVFAWGPWHDHEVLARRLFAGLRDLDDRGAMIILCPLPGPGGLRDAIRDRLQKAART